MGLVVRSLAMNPSAVLDSKGESSTPSFSATSSPRLAGLLVHGVVWGLGLLYWNTRFHGVGGRVNHGDSAKFQFIGWIFGVSHPPGNPLYILLNGVWSHLPLPWDLPTRITLLSMLFAVGALYFVHKGLRCITSPFGAALGTLALGVGPTFWTFATEPEVYSLNALLLAGTIYYFLRWHDDGRLVDLGACIGLFVLAFANHLTIVAALPALMGAILVKRPSDLRRVPILLVAGLAGLGVAAVYLWMILRAHAGPPYSEFVEAVSPSSAWAFVTAREYQKSFHLFSLQEALQKRLPVVEQFLGRQWLSPMFWFLPLGLFQMGRRRPVVAGFFSFALLGMLAFAFAYEIPDPDGFYVPVVVLAAFGLGTAAGGLGSTGLSRVVVGGAALVLLGAPARLHLARTQALAPFELVEEMGDQRYILWDLPDVVARIPEGASFAYPCAHYGCMEVVNYFRFADETARQRRIAFVTLPSVPYYGASPVRTLSYGDGARRTICTLRDGDAELFRRHGITVERIERPGRRVGMTNYGGVPIYCTRPTAG